MYSELLKQRIGDNLQEHIRPGGTEITSQWQENTVVGFIIPPGLWEALLEQVLDVALDLLDGCLSKRTAEEIAAGKELGVLQRWVVRRKIRKSEIDDDYREFCCDALVKTLQTSSQDEIKGLAEEMQQVTVDWSLF